MFSRMLMIWWTIPACTLILVTVFFVHPENMGLIEKNGPYSVPVSGGGALHDDFVMRTEVKQSIVSDLVQAKISLHEATVQFLMLNEEIPSVARSVRWTYAGKTEEEKTTRNVLEYVMTSDHSKKSKKQTLRRLQAEFESLYGVAVDLRNLRGTSD